MANNRFKITPRIKFHHVTSFDVMQSLLLLYTVEPRLSEPYGRHTIRPDNRGVRIDEGSRNSRSMGYRVGDN